VGDQIFGVLLRHKSISKREALLVAENMLRLTEFLPGRASSASARAVRGMRSTGDDRNGARCEPKLLIATNDHGFGRHDPGQIMHLIVDLNQKLGWASF
jgi:hypothetical protein